MTSKFESPHRHLTPVPGAKAANATIGERSDAELVSMSRGGSTEAFAVLRRRHERAARVVAAHYTPGGEADDLIADSFSRVLDLIMTGKSPRNAFRAYLFTAIKETAADRSLSKRQAGQPTGEPSIDPSRLDPSQENDPVVAVLEKSLTAQAFRTLPARWQEVLWYSEVERMSSREFCVLLGLDANAGAAFAARAREALGRAWIQAQIASVPEDSTCKWTIERAERHTRRLLPRRDIRRFDDHITKCQACLITAAEAEEVGPKLALVLLPLAAGVSAAAAYTSWLQNDSTTSAGAMAAALPTANAPHAVPALFDPQVDRQTDRQAERQLPASASIGLNGASGSGSLVSTRLALAGMLTMALAGGTAIVVPTLAAVRESMRADAAPDLLGGARSAQDATASLSHSGPVLFPTDRRPVRPIEPAWNPVAWSEAEWNDAEWRDAEWLLDQQGTTEDQAESSPTTAGAPRVSPGAPVVEVMADPSGLFYPTASGMADPGAVVEIVELGGTDPNGSVVATATANDEGIWHMTAIAGLGFGTHLLAARQVDIDGNRSPLSGVGSVTIESITVSEESSSTTGAETVTVSGRPWERFEVLLDGVPVDAAFRLDATGSWSGRLREHLEGDLQSRNGRFEVRYSDLANGVSMFGPSCSIDAG